VRPVAGIAASATGSPSRRSAPARETYAKRSSTSGPRDRRRSARGPGARGGSRPPST
jgi:hypothetical protein